MNFRKPTQPSPQEMVQVDRSATASPFWRTASANSQRQQQQTPEKERKVIGASYSHADNLSLTNLNLGIDQRPRTPPASQRNRSTPPPRSTISPPPRRTYTSFVSETNDAWQPHETPVDDDVDFGQDEDEFGLPSIVSTRRQGKRIAGKKTNDPGGTGCGNTRNGATHAGTWALDSGDVAEERAIPSYPSAKKAEGKLLRPQYKDILHDPANSLHLISHPSVPLHASAKDHEAHAARITRINKFKKLLQSSTIPLSALREAAWSGLPPEVRAMSWQLLLNYLPTSSERRITTLERKRKEYLDGVAQAFSQGSAGDVPTRPGMAEIQTAPAVQIRGKGRGLDEAIWHQISIDVPRTNPHLPLYGYEATQRSLERILYVWAIRHPASGYVQGINDLVTPFWQVFLGQYITSSDVESGVDPGMLPKAVLDAVEADSFWCLTKLLEGIQDNYIHAQPGIIRQVAALRDLTARIDGTLARHLDEQGVEFIQFSFRWMNCLLMREISVRNTIRMWDTYLAETDGPSHFHLYVCAAFLVKWSDKLCKMDFQEIMMFLQALPTRNWTEGDVELLLSEAFIWQSLFEGTKAHVPVREGSGIMGM
ncbi:hypothetical protein B0A48_15037 [Cryoendolithus antarcticus]|uniref:Rab-GAP TBC domain-containing protein n=1 Tax=Cryoendolithus antarcticus TaxID=1507870 RepID=A0A1V8SJ79_9PEZI|nr:hypothetical protein B0A48_15037 [Cryoendolithus antarcticus]